MPDLEPALGVVHGGNRQQLEVVESTRGDGLRLRTETPVPEDSTLRDRRAG